MDKLVYTAATGLRSHMAAQAAIANNIANGSTTGFRAERIVFDRLMLNGRSGEFASRAPTAEETTDIDRSSGALIRTGRPLDVAAVAADHWIAVQASDGTEAYTKRGDLSITASGTLQTGDGHLVMGAGGGPITIPPHERIAIAGDGTISIVPLGDTTGEPQVIDTIKLVSTKGSQTAKGLDNLLRVKGGGALPQDMTARIEAETLEGSNVNMTQALVDMIENQRSYEVQANLLKEAKTMDEGAASLMRLPG